MLSRPEREVADRGVLAVVGEVPLDLHLRPGGVIDVSHEMSCDLVLSASASVILAPGVVRPRIDTNE